MKPILPILTATIVTLSSPTCNAQSVEDWTEANLDSLVKLYFHLHSNPELSYQEKETSERIAAEWERAGYQVTPNIGGFGVVAILKNGPGPTVMLRTDLDALPVTEATGLEYASTAQVANEDGSKTGVMHACGHDIHMANLVGVARYLAVYRDRWQGTLMLIGQPAEERVGGAKAMTGVSCREQLQSRRLVRHLPRSGSGSRYPDLRHVAPTQQALARGLLPFHLESQGKPTRPRCS